VIVTLAIGWALVGLVIIVAGLSAGRSPLALRVGLGATCFAMAGLGAVGNAALVASGFDFAGAADASCSATVREGLGTAGSAQMSLFVALLIALQASAGLVILFGGQWVEVGLAVAIAMQVGLLAFGWWYFLTSPIMIMALALLWQAHRRQQHRPLYVPDILQAQHPGHRR
jgi:hypothetical protein